MSAGLLLVLLASPLASALASPLASLDQPSPQDRLAALQRDIARLRREAAALSGREQGVLGELTRLDAEQALKRAELLEVEARLQTTLAALASGGAQLQALEATRADRARYLGFRLREIYKRGPGFALRRLTADNDEARVLRGVRYGALLSERDARQLRAFRLESADAARQRGVLEAEQVRLAALGTELRGATDALGEARGRQARFLADVRGDRAKKETAASELEGAARDLAGLLREQGIAASALDPRGLRGTLPWPFPGRVAARFGRTVDPRFGTAVPHPGLDLEGPAGTPFRAVLDGTVLWAGPLRGYGLTAIVDHGSGVATVYAHAAGLVVEKGDPVARGQTLGQLGETGERAPYLYFELREGGRPVDPEDWLAPR